MAISSRNTLKSWFETGDYPTQQQFANWIDSYFHLEEDTLPMDQVEGLEAALENIQSPEQTTTREFKVQKYPNANSNKTFVMEAKSIIRAIDINYVSGSPVVRCGTTPGGTQIMTDRTITSAKDSNNQVPRSFPTETTLYITISGGTVNLNLDYETNYF